MREERTSVPMALDVPCNVSGGTSQGEFISSSSSVSWRNTPHIYSGCGSCLPLSHTPVVHRIAPRDVQVSIASSFHTASSSGVCRSA